MDNISFSNFSISSRGITNIQFAKQRDTETVRVIAGKEFKEGEVILDEEPTLCAQYYYSKGSFPACSHCLRSTESPYTMVQRLTQGKMKQPLQSNDFLLGIQGVFCDQCSDMYCCDDCKTVAWETYHRWLCIGEQPKIAEHYERLVELWKSTPCPSGYIHISLLLRILSSIANLMDAKVPKEEALSIWEEFFSNEDEKLYDIHFKGVESIIETSFRICCDIFETCHIQEVISFDYFKRLFTICAFNTMEIHTSAFQGYVHNLTNNETKKSDDFWEDVNDIEEAIQDLAPNNNTCDGAGLYMVSGRLRHQCRPNCTLMYSPNSFTIRILAAKNIKAGETLTRNCLGFERDGSLNVKSSLLLCNRYLAHCQCKQCLQLGSSLKNHSAPPKGWFSGMLSNVKSLLSP